MEDRYGDQTIGEMMQAYAPPNENDTDHYVEFIENQTGLSRDNIVGDLSEDKLGALADAINTMEGGHEGETYEAGASDNPDWVDDVIGSGSDDGSDATGDDTNDGSDDTTGTDDDGNDSGDDASDDDGSTTSSVDDGDSGDSDDGGDGDSGGDAGGGGDDGRGGSGDGDGGGLERRVRAPRALPSSDARGPQVARRT